METSAPAVEDEFETVLARKEVISDRVVKLTLCDPGGAALPSWEPGAHIDLVLRDDLIRQYSLCGDPAQATQIEVAVLRESASRGGSEFIHNHLEEGDAVRIRGPRNHFELVDAGSYVFIAGGIGITPIVPMVKALSSRGAAWRLIYGGRTTHTMAFREQLLARHPGQVDIRPEDETGLLDIAGIVGELAADADTVVYCCGPEPLLTAVEEACEVHRVTLRVERFAPKSGALDTHCGPFEVKLARTGITVAVPADVSIVEALEEAGIEVPTSCEEGICGTCQTTVLAGIPEHHDSVLTADERAAGNTMTVCVSRARSSPLVLDL